MGEKIIAWRMARGLSMSQFAELAGVSKQTLRYIESGKRTNIQAGTLKKIAAVMGCTLDFLVA